MHDVDIPFHDMPINVIAMCTWTMIPISYDMHVVRHATDLLKSLGMIVAILGCWTLATTLVPSFSTARWTWAILAAANGTSSKDWNNAEMDCPKSSVITRSTCEYGEAGTESCNFDNSRIHGSGNTSAREDRYWPTCTWQGGWHVTWWTCHIHMTEGTRDVTCHDMT